MADAPTVVASPAATVGTGGQNAPPPSTSGPPSKVFCSQTVPVPQSGTLASALVNIGLVLLLLEAAAALKRKLAWVPLLSLPAWMDPYVREVAAQQAPEKISSTVNVAELEANIARAFGELDQAQLLFKPAADSKEVSVSLLGFLQQCWSLAAAGDTGRLQRQMKNIEGLLEANGYKLVSFTEPDRHLFEVVLQPSVDKPETVLPAIVDAGSRRVAIRGQAFVAHR